MKITKIYREVFEHPTLLFRGVSDDAWCDGHRIPNVTQRLEFREVLLDSAGFPTAAFVEDMYREVRRLCNYEDINFAKREAEELKTEMLKHGVHNFVYSLHSVPGHPDDVEYIHYREIQFCFRNDRYILELEDGL